MYFLKWNFSVQINKNRNLFFLFKQNSIIFLKQNAYWYHSWVVTSLFMFISPNPSFIPAVSYGICQADSLTGSPSGYVVGLWFCTFFDGSSKWVTFLINKVRVKFTHIMFRQMLLWSRCYFHILFHLPWSSWTHILRRSLYGPESLSDN